MKQQSTWARKLRLSMVFLLTMLVALPILPAMGQRGFGRGGGSFSSGRSFGGGGSFRSGGGGGSFSGGSFGTGRSGGSGSFSSGRSSGGSFGTGRSSGGSFGSGRSSGSSFGSGRSSSGGSFGNSGVVRSTSVRPSYYGRTPSSTNYYMYNGARVPGYGFGFWSGYSLGWAMSPPWYYHTPFHPAFYFHPPVYYQGGLYPGGFNWLHFFIGLLILGFVIWLIGRIFLSGRRKGVKYTTYG